MPSDNKNRSALEAECRARHPQDIDHPVYQLATDFADKIMMANLMFTAAV